MDTSRHGRSQSSISRSELCERGICPTCLNLCSNRNSNIFPNKWWGGYSPPRSELLREYRASAQQGCTFCALLTDGIDQVDRDSWGKEDVSLDEETELDVLGTNPLQIILKNQGSALQRCLYYFVQPGCESPFESIKPMKQVCYHPEGARGCLELLPDAIGRCMEEHAACRNTDEVFLPRRVIDVGNDDQEPFLLDSKGMMGRYISLSHRWGGIKPLVTTRENLAEMRTAIHLDTIPKTFLETIMVARTLGVPYVWIDCVCMVQDDSLEWQTDSSKMADIYGNSYLTIAATVSENAHGGIFYGPSHDGSGPFEVDRSVTEKIGPSIFVKEIAANKQFHGYYSSGPAGGVGFPLHSRAWAHQEFFLAPRVVQFGHELQWDCSESSWCCSDFQSFKGSGFVPAVNFGRHGKKIPQLCDLGEDPDQDQKKRVAAAWRREVEVYSGKSITNPFDRLPAFSGIAQRFLSLGMNPPYLAGIWQINIKTELSWRTLKPGSRPTRYRAPSFSWASVEAGIQFVLPDDANPCIELVSAHCEPAYADPFGAVEAGFLKVRGTVVKGRACFASMPKLATEAKRLLQQSVCVGGVQYPFSADVTNFLGDFGMSQDLWKHVTSEDLDHKLYCLVIGTDANDRKPQYMVLRQSPTRQNAFERVGWMPYPSSYGQKAMPHEDAEEMEITIV